MAVTALIADDEPLARKKLRDLAADIEWLQLIGETQDGPSTVEAIDRLEPDLVFLDLQMPGYDGLEVLRRTTHRPGVVFTTAFDRYAVAAFELQAIDYLLKPFDAERFARATARARESLQQRDDPIIRDRPLGAMTMTIDRLFIRHGGRIVVVPLTQIESLEARRDYVAVHAPPNRYLVHLTLNHLESALTSKAFVRVHRSYLVNFNQVTELVPRGNGQLEVVLRSGARILASRSRSKGLWELAV
ncbi:MAG: LytR/AlgR family response regulator transcription factor [Gemmatimonadales bacterium]